MSLSKKFLSVIAIVLVLLPIGATAAPITGVPIIDVPVKVLSAAAKAATSDSPNIFGNPVAWLAYQIVYISSSIGGVFVAILGKAVEFMLDLNLRTINTPAVQGGYSVTLGIANLLLVLLIIVAAVATIIRNQTYGMKSLIKDIVIAAVVINFGLIIASGAISISNSLTNAFLTGVTGGGGPGKFAGIMAETFSPQKLFLPTSEKDGEQTSKIAKEISAAKGLEGIMSALVAVLMSFIGTIVIIVTLLAFVVMLAYRYLKIVVLLISFPLVLVARAFPKYKEYYSAWLKDFISQLLFPPAAIFFLWLALRVSEGVFDAGGTASFDGAIGSLAQAIFIPLMNIFILSGLMIMGLTAASKFGATGGEAAQKALAGGGKAAMGWAKKRATRGVTGAATRTAPRERPTNYSVDNVGALGKIKNVVNRGRIGVNTALNEASKASFAAGTPLRSIAQRTGLAESLIESNPELGTPQEIRNRAAAKLVELKEKRREIRREKPSVESIKKIQDLNKQISGIEEISGKKEELGLFGSAIKGMKEGSGLSAFKEKKAEKKKKTEDALSKLGFSEEEIKMMDAAGMVEKKKKKPVKKRSDWIADGYSKEEIDDFAKDGMVEDEGSNKKEEEKKEEEKTDKKSDAPKDAEKSP